MESNHNPNWFGYTGTMFPWKQIVQNAGLTPKQIFDQARKNGEEFCSIEKQKEIFTCVFLYTGP
jgi:hypothetical protein